MRFACTLCGDCCTGSQVVRLTGGDLRLLASRLGASKPSDLKKHGVISLVREGGDGGIWRPRLRFRTRPLRQCPFLVNEVENGVYRGLCSLHPNFKPLVCALSPLARLVTDFGTRTEERWSFVPPVKGCPGVGRGEAVPIGAPPSLKIRLDEEVSWLRRLSEASSSCPDETSAWAWLDQWAGDAWSPAS